MKPVGLIGAALLGARLFLGSIDRSRHVLRLRGAQFEIDRPAAGLIHTDGEPHREKSHLSIKVAPQSLRVVIPARSPAVAITRPGRSVRTPLALP